MIFSVFSKHPRSFLNHTLLQISIIATLVITSPMVSTAQTTDFCRLELSSESSSFFPAITTFAYSERTNLLAIAGDDFSIRLVDLGNGTNPEHRIEHANWIRALAFRADGRALHTYGSVVHLTYEEDCGRWLLQSTSKTACVSEDSFRTEGRLLGNLASRPIKSFQDTPTVKRNSFVATVSKDPQKIASRAGFADKSKGSISSEAFSANEVSSIRIWPGNADLRIRDFEFLPSEKHVATCSERGVIQLFHVDNHESVLSIQVARCNLFTLTVLSERYIATGGSDNRIYIVDLKKHDVVRVLTGHVGSISALQQCGTKLASGGFDTDVLLWDVSEFCSSE